MKQYQAQLIYRARQEGCVWVYWDGKKVHRRYVHGITSTTNKAVVASCIRITKNTGIQGGASLYTLHSILVLKHMQRKNMVPGLIEIVGTVHDSIWFEIWEDQLKECVDTIGRVMVGFPCKTKDGIEIPLEVDGKVGPSLGEMKKCCVVSSDKIERGARFDYGYWKTDKEVRFV